MVAGVVAYFFGCGKSSANSSEVSNVGGEPRNALSNVPDATIRGAKMVKNKGAGKMFGSFTLLFVAIGIGVMIDIGLTGGLISLCMALVSAALGYSIYNDPIPA